MGEHQVITMDVCPVTGVRGIFHRDITTGIITFSTTRISDIVIDYGIRRDEAGVLSIVDETKDLLLMGSLDLPNILSMDCPLSSICNYNAEPSVQDSCCTLGSLLLSWLWGGTNGDAQRWR